MDKKDKEEEEPKDLR